MFEMIEREKIKRIEIYNLMTIEENRPTEGKSF